MEVRDSFPIEPVLNLSSEMVRCIARSEHENDFKFDFELKEADCKIVFLIILTDFFSIDSRLSSSSSVSAPSAPDTAGTVLVMVVNTGH
jgi:hypothetical protein